LNLKEKYARKEICVNCDTLSPVLGFGWEKLRVMLDNTHPDVLRPGNENKIWPPQISTLDNLVSIHLES